MLLLLNSFFLQFPQTHILEKTHSSILTFSFPKLQTKSSSSYSLWNSGRRQQSGTCWSDGGKEKVTVLSMLSSGRRLRGQHLRIMRDASMTRLSTSLHPLASCEVLQRIRTPSASKNACLPDPAKKKKNLRRSLFSFVFTFFKMSSSEMILHMLKRH